MDLSSELNPIKQKNPIEQSMETDPTRPSPSSTSHSAMNSRINDTSLSKLKRSREHVEKNQHIKNQKKILQKRFNREERYLDYKLRDSNQRETDKAHELVKQVLDFRQKVRNGPLNEIEIKGLRETLENCNAGLIRALQAGNTEAVKEYCQVVNVHNTNHDCIDEHGVTPLMLAALTHPENTEVLEILLEHGADIHAVDDKGMMALDYLEESLGYMLSGELEEENSQIQKSKEILLQAGCKICGKDPILYGQARTEWQNWKSIQEFTEPLYISVQSEEDGSWRRVLVVEPRYVYMWVFNHIHADQQLHPQSNQHVNPELTFQEINELLFFHKKNYRERLENGDDLINENNHDWTQNVLGKAMLAHQKETHPVRGHPHMVNILLKAGANIEIVSESCHYTPLMHATLYKQEKILKLLLDAGADRNARTPDGNSALILATRLAVLNMDRTIRHKILTILLNEPTVNKELRNNDGDTALLDAFKLYNGQRDPYETIELLLDHGVDIRAKDQKGNTLLMLAIQTNHLKVIQLVLSRGSRGSRDPRIAEIPNNQGTTPLQLAIQQHNTGLIRILLKHGVDLNAKDKNGNTALMRTRDINVMKLLLSPPLESRSFAAEIDARNNSGETALIRAIKWAITNKNLDDSGENNDLNVIKFLLNSGAGVNPIKPLSTPISYTDPTVVKMLGGDPNSPIVKEIRELLKMAGAIMPEQ